MTDPVVYLGREGKGLRRRAGYEGRWVGAAYVSSERERESGEQGWLDWKVCVDWRGGSTCVIIRCPTSPRPLLLSLSLDACEPDPASTPPGPSSLPSSLFLPLADGPTDSTEPLVGTPTCENTLYDDNEGPAVLAKIVVAESGRKDI